MKRRTRFALLGATVGALAIAATPSMADDMPLTATTVQAPSVTVGEDRHYAAVRAALDRLSLTQTPADIQAILESDQPAETLYDTTTNTYLAARLAEPLPGLFGITPRGPGCATTDACATGSTSYGYYGQGQLDIRLSGITRVFSGDAPTTWWQRTESLYQRPNVTNIFPPPATLYSIVRG